MKSVKRVNRELLEEIAQMANQWAVESVKPGSGAVVLTIERMPDGVTKTIASAAIADDSKVTWDNGSQIPVYLSTRLHAEGLVQPITVEDKPEPVNLSHMWRLFETRNYITPGLSENIEYAVSRDEPIKSVTWVCLPGVGTGAFVPGGIPRKVLENVFLAHAYAFLRQVVLDNLGLSPLVTRGVNRPEITGLSKIPKVVRAGDGQLVRDVLCAIALELSVRGVTLEDDFQESIRADHASAKESEIAADKAAKYWA